MRAAIALGLSCVMGVAACGSAGVVRAPLGEARLLAPDDQRLQVVELPLDGELWLAPRDVIVTHELQGDEGAGQRARLQVIVRLRRHDGGVVEWMPSAAARSTAGAGARPVELGPRPTRVTLAPATLGPVRVRRVASIEVLIAVLPQPDDALPAGRMVGAAAVGGAPVLGADGGAARERFVESAAEAGGIVLLAAAAPVAPRTEWQPGETEQILRWTASSPAGSSATLELGLRVALAEHPGSGPEAP